MNKKIWPFFILPFLVLGCAGLQPLEEREKMYGKSVPAITQSFASRQISPGDTWKVYLNASDPDGDMKNMVCIIEQPGRGVYPASYTRISEGNRKELSGFIYLFTGGAEGLNFVNFTLTVQIQDRAGHFSQPATFPLSINSGFKQEAPPAGIFQERDLGPIMISVRSLSPNDGHMMLDAD